MSLRCDCRLSSVECSPAAEQPPPWGRMQFSAAGRGRMPFAESIFCYDPGPLSSKRWCVASLHSGSGREQDQQPRVFRPPADVFKRWICCTEPERRLQSSRRPNELVQRDVCSQWQDVPLSSYKPLLGVSLGWQCLHALGRARCCYRQALGACLQGCTPVGIGWQGACRQHGVALKRAFGSQHGMRRQPMSRQPFA